MSTGKRKDTSFRMRRKLIRFEACLKEDSEVKSRAKDSSARDGRIRRENVQADD